MWVLTNCTLLPSNCISSRVLGVSPGVVVYALVLLIFTGFLHTFPYLYQVSDHAKRLSSVYVLCTYVCLCLSTLLVVLPI